MAGFDFGSITSVPSQHFTGNPTGQQTPDWMTKMGLGADGQPLPTAAQTAAQATSTGTTPFDVINRIIQQGTNAVPDSLKDLAKFTTNTMTSTQAVGAPIQAASDATADYIKNFIGNGTGSGGDQSQQFITDMLSGKGAGAAGTAAITSAMNPTDTKFLDSGATQLKAHTLADTDMSKYMNPALAAEQGAILHGNDVMNNATRARQARSGAFGENSDVAQAQNNESTQRQLALSASDAFKNASANAMTDVGALNQTDVGNRGAVQGVNAEKLGANLSDSQRGLAAGQASNAGALATGNEAWQQYLQKIGMGAQLGQSAAGSLAALPGAKTQTTQSLGPSAAGTEIGALIGLTGVQQQYDPKNKTGGGVSFSNVA